MLDIDKINGVVTAIATILVAVFTIVLALVTNRQAKLTKIVAEAAVKSADAAKLSAEALIDAERATLCVVITASNLKAALAPAVRWPNSPTMDSGPVSNVPFVQFMLTNLGKTSAVITEASYQLIQASAEHRTWEYGLEVVPDPIIAGAGSSTSISCHPETTFSVGDSRRALDGTRPLFFYGRCVFRTAFGRDYEYIWRYQSDRMQWVLVYHEQRPLSPTAQRDTSGDTSYLSGLKI